MEFNLDRPTEHWVQYFNSNCVGKDLIILFDNDDDAIWFASNMAQKLSVLGGSEVVSICGALVNDIAQFTAQVNVSLPCGYRMSSKPEALYDTLLNFETEPENRVLIWSDAQHLLEIKLSKFELIFELLVKAAFINRNGIGTIKDDGTEYKVNQRNILVFVGVERNQLLPLLEREYLIPLSAKSNEEQSIKFEFEIVEVVTRHQD